jgi:hypothetical protein
VTFVPEQPSAPAGSLADKLSALMARVHPGATGAPAHDGTGVQPALSELTAHLAGDPRGDLLAELGDLRAEVAAVGDEATEASGRLAARAAELLSAQAEEAKRAADRATGVEERLHALQTRVDAFALDLAAGIRAEGVRLEAVLRAALEDSVLVLAEALVAGPLSPRQAGAASR